MRSHSHSRERKKKKKLLAALLPGEEEQLPPTGLHEHAEQQQQDHHAQGDEPQENPEVGSWCLKEPDHSCDPTIAFTRSHPIGSLLLKMKTDITKLAVLAKMKSMV